MSNTCRGQLQVALDGAVVPFARVLWQPPMLKRIVPILQAVKASMPGRGWKNYFPVPFTEF
ncbi:hypothetical protein AM571_CH03267 [Rhizobium etli 8C-3]|uniref:Uncharacterized protein n=1 Tax=Rhizobium etli 8C-3 TaxID=538025 RepID=A0A1L5P7F7_RHIET|nr:hypothetical protein AM571_CH03267 [Rhizobium etli 8C-3]